MKLNPFGMIALAYMMPTVSFAQEFSVREIVHVFEWQNDYDHISKLMTKKSFIRISSDSLITYVPEHRTAGSPVEKLILFPAYKNVQYLTTSYDIYINWGNELRKAGYAQHDTYTNKNMPAWMFTKGDISVFVAIINGGKYYMLSVHPADFPDSISTGL